MEEEKKYYVYEWFNTNTKEVFYVGSGTAYRWKQLSNRNNLFNNYYDKNNCDVRKVYVNLSRNEARKLEEELTDEYKKNGQCICNKYIGYKHTEDQKKAASVPIVQLTKDYNFVNLFSGAKEASRELNIDRPNIVHCLQGDIKSSSGFIWMYLSEYLDLLKHSF